MRKAAKDEAAQEGARIRQETERELAKIQTNADHEIANALKTAQIELKSYSAQLAVDLARKKVRDRMTPPIRIRWSRRSRPIWAADPSRLKPMPAAVASRYARALVDVVLGPKSRVDADRVRQDLRSFEQALANSLELGNALASPAVKRPRKRSVITRLAQALDLSPVARNFLLVLVDHRRTSELSDIILAFERIVDERLGRVQADVVSARELKEPQQAALVRQLEAMSGKKVRLNLSVDGDLVGGVIVRLGSTVYDGSVRGQLDALSRQLRAE